MKLLIDQNLPKQLASILQSHSHDAIHTDDVELAKAADPQILAWCCTHERMLITADKKLTKFLAASAADCPSVLIVRAIRIEPLSYIAPMLVANLPQLEEVIAEHGNAVFSLARDKPIRAQLLPLGVPGKVP